MAPTLASQRLLEFTLPDGACVTKKGEAVELSLHRSALHVAVTVPIAVLEWFVEASDRSSGASVEDWRDYEGYDSTPAEQLDRDMADDVETFVGGYSIASCDWISEGRRTLCLNGRSAMFGNRQFRSW
jgi:hypothetical protein